MPGPVPCHAVPPGSRQRRGRQRARSGRGSAVLRRLGRVPPFSPAPPAPLSPPRRQNKAPGPGPGSVPPCNDATVRGSGRGRAPALGLTLRVPCRRRSHPAGSGPATTSRSVPAAPAPRSLQYRRPLQCPERSGAPPVPRPPRCGCGPAERSAAGRRWLGAGSARRLLLKSDPAPPSAPRSLRRPPPRPVPERAGGARPQGGPGRASGGAGGASVWPGSKGSGSRIGTRREKGLDPGYRRMEGSAGCREPEKMGRGWQEPEQEWDGTGQGEGWAGDEMRLWATLGVCGDVIKGHSFLSTAVASSAHNPELK